MSMDTFGYYEAGFFVETFRICDRSGLCQRQKLVKDLARHGEREGHNQTFVGKTGGP